MGKIMKFVGKEKKEKNLDKEEWKKISKVGISRRRRNGRKERKLG